MALVYNIIFDNGKRYIGITSKNIEDRMANHIARMRYGDRPNKLYSAMKAHTYTVEILEKCNSFEIAKEREKYWIKLFNTNGNYGYNMTDGGDGTVGYRPSAATLKRLSESHKGYRMPELQKKAIGNANRDRLYKNARTIIGVHIDTGKVLKYNSITEIEKEGVFHKGCISGCCLGKRKTHKKYVWNYIGDQCRQN